MFLFQKNTKYLKQKPKKTIPCLALIFCPFFFPLCFNRTGRNMLSQIVLKLRFQNMLQKAYLLRSKKKKKKNFSSVKQINNTKQLLLFFLPTTIVVNIKVPTISLTKWSQTHGGRISRAFPRILNFKDSSHATFCNITNVIKDSSIPCTVA